MSRNYLFLTCIFALLAVCGIAEAADYSLNAFLNGFEEDFDVMGETGTIAPQNPASESYWQVVVGGTDYALSLTPADGWPSNQGYNMGFTTAAGQGDPTDRALGTYAGGIGDARTLSCTVINDTGRAISSLTLLYDIEAWIQRTAGNEGGYRLTYDDGTTTVVFDPDYFIDVEDPEWSGNHWIDGNFRSLRDIRHDVDLSEAPLWPNQVFTLTWDGRANIPDSRRRLGIGLDNFRITGYVPPTISKATGPSPSHGQSGVGKHPELTWEPGEPNDSVESHDIYFSASWADVNSADPAAYQLKLTRGNESFSPGLLELGKTYYWRVDELNETNGWAARGDIWAFTVHTGVASNPTPSDNAAQVAPEPVLSWDPGISAVMHDIYIGTSPADVNNASDPHTAPGRARTADPNFDTAGRIDFQLGQTYYWRVDEVNLADETSIIKGNIWSFTVAEYLVVEDMESYGDANTPGEPGQRIWYAWQDGFGWSNPAPGSPGNGTGSIVGNWPPPVIETEIVHGTGQSMPLYYVNDGTTVDSFGNENNAYYSEIQRRFDPAADWTKWSPKAMVLWIRGLSTNAQEPMYFKLTDASGNFGYIFYGEKAGEEPDDITEETWREWIVPLADFGVDLTHVAELAIGVGNPDNSTIPGGSGTLYLDDILLYPPTCRDDFTGIGDFNGDCVIDHEDLYGMAQDWLAGEYYVTAELVSQTPVAWYSLDSIAGSTAVNSGTAGPAANGAVNGGAAIVSFPAAGSKAAGSAVELYGETAVNCGGEDPTPPYEGWADFPGSTSDFALSAWVRIEAADQGQMSIISKGGYLWNMTIRGSGQAGLDCLTGITDIKDGRWHSVTGVVSGGRHYLYVDGALEAENTCWTRNFGNAVTLGQGLAGLLDEVKVFGDPLTHGQVLDLAGYTPGSNFLQSVKLNTNLYNQEPAGSRGINLRDFAILADHWLEEHLWP